ncbi:MAG: aminoacyl-tRNA hydrolase [Myxococcota bacterium]
MKLLAGLGNPGKKYEGTRHNIGFRVIEHLAARHAARLSRRKFNSLLWQGVLRSERNEVSVLLLNPQTFMNRSGSAVARAADYHGIAPEDIVVVHDDLDLPFGKLRVRERGGDSGQRGVGSIIESLGTDGFVRLRVGVGRPPVHVPPEDYVLQAFLPAEAEQLPEILDRAAEALEAIVFEGSIPAMNRFNP